MATFPTITRSPGLKSFTEELSRNTVRVASMASGLPVLNKLFTFDPLEFKHTLNLVAQADKETVMAHYEAHMDIPFDWINTQKPDTPITYEVIYAQPPKCQLDGLRDRWRISITFIQYSSL